MATLHPRIQVTVDPELARALAQVDPAPSSRARLVRDLALRGAEVVHAEREAMQSATDVLLGIASGEIPYDFEALAEIWAEREAKLP